MLSTILSNGPPLACCTPMPQDASARGRASDQPGRVWSWPVWIALAFGAILPAAGVLLFVSIPVGRRTGAGCAAGRVERSGDCLVRGAGRDRRGPDVSLAMFGWCAIVRDRRGGVASLAIAVLASYYLNVMDKLGRSARPIGSGLLFLGSGWVLERTRRARSFGWR